LRSGCQRAQFATHHQRFDIGDLALGHRVDATQDHRQHVGLAHHQALQVHVRRHAGHAREPAQTLRQGPLVDTIGRPCGHDPRVGTQCQQPIAQLALEPIHDRQHHDERGHAQGDASERHPGDERHEELVLPGAHIAQRHEQGQRLEHRAAIRTWGRCGRKSQFRHPGGLPGGPGRRPVL
jgi:hypothetical protein